MFFTTPVRGESIWPLEEKKDRDEMVEEFVVWLI